MGYGDTLPEYVKRNSITLKNTRNVTGFTLHGIWPTRNDGSYPSYCDENDGFDVNQIETLIPDLDVAWYDYEAESDYGLWSHEWDKHGTCAAELPALSTQYNFFNYGISLYNNLDIAVRE